MKQCESKWQGIAFLHDSIKLCFCKVHKNKSLLLKVIHYKIIWYRVNRSFIACDRTTSSINFIADWSKLIKIFYRTLPTHILVESYKCDPVLHQEDKYLSVFWFCDCSRWFLEMSLAVFVWPELKWKPTTSWGNLEKKKEGKGYVIP